ncbi:hypothetical protein [Colwellia psychrerythraea]|uniref:Methyltransferase type 11 n=1 Tax=Colwellia psychrerythraea TaxID=28229 RepID=A0A099L4D0_COLPS|nr:hypothetical protein [Colwellia psychrerythraea]KGJ97002.1 hypothetical protein GAB14E_1470 [Colwellia psychrerythraea]
MCKLKKIDSIEEKIELYQVAKEALSKGQNMVKTLIDRGASKSDSIEISYELQAGEYTRGFNEKSLRRNKELHKIIDKYLALDGIDSVGVFGVGEAKNWIGYEGKIKSLFGVELSFSRLRFAFDNISKLKGINSFQLFKGDASEVTFANNSFDLSITLHSIEPNGNEQGAKILENVINSSSKYIILFEPDFSTAHDVMKERMIKNDYVRNIAEKISKNDSVNVIDCFVTEIQENENNKTTCWILEKVNKVKLSEMKLVCPYTNDALVNYKEGLYSPQAGLIYSKINDFFLLNKRDAIFIGEKQ